MTVSTTELWSLEERQAWTPPEDLKPADWAERHRELDLDASIPGPWRNANAPYLRGFMNLCLADGVHSVSMGKCAQSGVSEAARNVMGYLASQGSAPIGLALPDKAKGRKIVRNRVIPLFEKTNILKNLISEKAHDTASEQIRLNNGCIIHLMWSGSPSAMASDPMCYAFCDEVDKFAVWAGREADPVGQIDKRLRTYGERAKRIDISTPTTRYGVIWQLLEASDVMLHFHVPCPHCGKRQRLVFPQLKWEREVDETDKHLAARLRRDPRATWYECRWCGKAITHRQRGDMVRSGLWQTDDGAIQDAEAVERWPAGTRIGMHVSGLYVLWLGWGEIAAEFVEAKGNTMKTFNFRTLTLGEPFEQQMSRTRSDIYSAKSRRATLAEGVVPQWAVKLLATIDTQHDHFYGVIRAWGPDMRSQRVWHGRLETFEEIERTCRQTRWQVENHAAEPMRPELTLIDSGGTKLAGESASRTMAVYRWAIRRRRWVRAIKGDSKPREGSRIRVGRGYIDDASPGHRLRRRTRRDGPSVPIWLLDTHHFNDELHDQIMKGIVVEDQEPEPEMWLLNSRDDDVYNHHMANVHKVPVPYGAILKEEWVPVQSGARIDYRDCEVYQVAAAYMANVHLLPSAEDLAAQRARQQSRKRRNDKRRRDGDDDPWNATSLGDYV